MGNCITCSWYYKEDGKCHNPDCYGPGEDHEYIDNPYDDYCTLYEKE